MSELKHPGGVPLDHENHCGHTVVGIGEKEVCTSLHDFLFGYLPKIRKVA